MWAEARNFLERAERLQRQFFEPAPGAHGARWEPPIDVFETEHELSVIVALPGVAPDAMQVHIDGHMLVITGARTLPPFARRARIHRLEIPYGRFERRIALSSGRLRLDRREVVDGCLALTFTKSF